LHLAHGEAERPRVGGEVVENVIGEVSGVHLGYDIVMIDVGRVLEEGDTVDVQGRGVEVEFLTPCGTRRLARNEVKRFHGVVEVAEINFSVGVRRELILSLGDEKFVFGIGEELSLISVKVHVVTEDLGGGGGGITIAALHTNLNIVVLKGYEGQGLSPVLAKEERNHVVVTRVVLLAGVGGNCKRSLSRGIAHERIVNTLDVQRVQLGNLLTTNPESELGWARSIAREKTIGVCHHVGDLCVFDPDVAHEITLGADGDGDFIRSTKGADVIHALRLHGEVGITLIVLAEETDLGVTGDVHILSTDRYELN